VTSNGYTAAPASTVLIAGDPWGGSNLLEMRVRENQSVKRGEVIAVLSNYLEAETYIRVAEAELAKAKRQREAISRETTIAMQEISIKSLDDQVKLKSLELARSNGPPDVKQLQLDLSRTNLEREQARLRTMKEARAYNLARIDEDLKILRLNLETMRIKRELALVRSPLDGTVVQVYARAGERVGQSGIVKIVDTRQMCVIATVDEQHMDRAHIGAKVEVTFRGSANTYPGKISRVASVVKPMQRTDPDGAPTADTPVVQVEIELENPPSVPLLIGQEAKVTFL